MYSIQPRYWMKSTRDDGIGNRGRLCFRKSSGSGVQVNGAGVVATVVKMPLFFKVATSRGVKSDNLPVG
jgi:hypothetical protein